MAKPPWILLVFVALVTGIMFCAGCLSLEIGDVSYSDGGINISFNNEGNSTIRILKITVYQVDNFEQREVLQKSEMVTLKPGESSLFIPLPLERSKFTFPASMSPRR